MESHMDTDGDFSSVPPIWFKDGKGTTELHWAAHDGDLERIQRAIEDGYDLEEKDQWGRTPLLRAAFMGHTDAFNLLFRYGADIEATDDWKRNAEHLSRKQGHIELSGFINTLTGGDLLHSRDNYGRTPAHLAALKKQPESLRGLISLNCDVNARDDWCRTPLHLAEKEHFQEGVELLVQSGAHTDAYDIFGKTPREMS